MKDGKPVVLCIDDDKDIRESLSIILSVNGYLVITAENGGEGLELFKQEQPDFVLVDLAMETVDAGAVFAEKLKQLDSSVPVYLLSSAGDSVNDSVDYTELGFTGVMQKPVDPDQLLSMLKNRLG